MDLAVSDFKFNVLFELGFSFAVLVKVCFEFGKLQLARSGLNGVVGTKIGSNYYASNLPQMRKIKLHELFVKSWK